MPILELEFEEEKMKVRKRQWITVLALGLTIVLLVACGAKETPASAPPPTKALAATEEAAAPTTAPAATEAPTAMEEAAAPTTAPAAAEVPTATEEAEATEAPAAPSGDAKSVILQSAANMNNLKSYRSKVIVETAGQTMETLYEFVLPDRIHQVSDFGEMIIIGDDLYMKADDTWTKVPGGGAGTEMAQVGLTEEGILEAWLEGSEDVDGVPCQKYVYTAKMGDNPIEFTCWIGVEDGLPHKIVAKMADTTTTQMLYDVNADITIEAPPVAE
jgi:hypothetical protein